MANKLIQNARAPDSNIRRNAPLVQQTQAVSILPENFVTSPEELEVLKWALQFYLYQEKSQKISGKVFLNEITDDKKELATLLLQRIAN